jgi:DNA-binding XRE family transcriptional regulator
MNNVETSKKTLKELRMRVGLTQHALSELLGLRGKTIGHWERGLSEPHLPASKILLLCKTFDCSLEDLVEAIEATRKIEEPEVKDPHQKQLVAA